MKGIANTVLLVAARGPEGRAVAGPAEVPRIVVAAVAVEIYVPLGADAVVVGGTAQFGRGLQTPWPAPSESTPEQLTVSQ